MTTQQSPIAQRLAQLEKHLEQENPILLETVKSYRELDKVGYKLGVLPRDSSFATQITWWPLISVLGTFSAGKSTFINHYIGQDLQRSGNQAVDDKFTVICYSREHSPHALPGVALDSDPRFPFYRISEDIEEVSEGEGRRIDAYLQLKTAPSEALRGKIIIDSPGFDADAQRTSTLRITDHIIDLSDLVLVFFDARHPEPGAMRDTLDHLVSNTINRGDSGKFLYILNQLDTAAREDNPEEVVAAWQRALGERGLTAGRFFTVYSPVAATPIPDEARRKRFETKRDADLGEIHSRMDQVEVERAYRIVASLEHTTRDIEENTVPLLRGLLETWRKRTLIGSAAAVIFLVGIWLGSTGGSFSFPWQGLLGEASWGWIANIIIVAAILLGIHHGMRSLSSWSMKKQIRVADEAAGNKIDVIAAFAKSTGLLRSVFQKSPAGWNSLTRKRIHRLRQQIDNHVQQLNDRFTNPSGTSVTVAPVQAARETDDTLIEIDAMTEEPVIAAAEQSPER